MAEHLVFRKDWVVQMKEMLNNDDEKSLPKVFKILRVATLLLNEKPEAYIPQCLSLGPLHHWKMEKKYIDSSSLGGRIPNTEAYKGKSAAKLSQKLRNCGKSFDNIVEMIEPMLPEIGSFYDWPIRSSTEGDYSKNFALMMAVDSSFLLRFLFTLFRFHDMSQPMGAPCQDCPSLDADVIRLCSTLQVSIKCDIVKLENQIPLYVLKGVFEKVKETLAVDKGHQYFNQLLQKTCKEFSPFRAPEIDDAELKQMNDIDDEPHLLGCMHSFVSTFLQIDGGGEDQKQNRTLLQILREFLENLVIWVGRFLSTNPNIERNILKGISAGQLERAGMKLKSFSKVADKIRVDKCSETLYLPPIAVPDSSTEVFLRNMVALEFNDPLRPKPVTRYVTLMGCLIQSPDDVRLLKDRDVIYREYSSLTDEDIVKMSNNFTKPSLTSALVSVSDVKLTRALQEVLEKNYSKLYYKSEIKRMIWGFKTIWGLVDYFSSWKFIAPLCGFLALVMTAIQTYCTYSTWLVSSAHNSKQ